MSAFDISTWPYLAKPEFVMTLAPIPKSPIEQLFGKNKNKEKETRNGLLKNAPRLAQIVKFALFETVNKVS